MSQSTKKIEKAIITAIIQGEYAPNSTLQPERELATKYGVGRPRIREALQRLAHARWLTIRKGQPALINDYLLKGNVATIVDIVTYYKEIPDQFVLFFLELRSTMTSKYVNKAVMLNNVKVVSLLTEIETLHDSPNDYAAFDWKLQKELAYLSENPLFLLILNSFDEAYIKMATKYFTLSYCRKSSYNYYKELLAAALSGDYEEAEKATRLVMEKSYSLWENFIAKEESEALTDE